MILHHPLQASPTTDAACRDSRGVVHLAQRCGIETVVLEARDRVGGRVHSYSGGGFSAAVDLGASIITGTATDAAKGLRPDPSAVIARSMFWDTHINFVKVCV
jgi:hypothetical protein